MENAVDALKIGFAVLVFTMALSLTMYMFANARETSDMVLHGSDMSAYMEYVLPELGTESRIVGLETIIPTLYKYYKENYTVIFKYNTGENNFIPLYRTTTNVALWSEGYYNKYFGGSKSKDTRICSFDVNEETSRHEPWTGNSLENKKMLDKFVQGGDYVYTDSRGTQTIHFGNGLYSYRNKKFIENLGEYEVNPNPDEASNQNDHSRMVQKKKRRVIIYTLQN